MTETQAKSGVVGTSTTPAEDEAAEGAPTATGRVAVGRAVVPADSPSPKFTRAPGMTPPPDEPPADGAGPAESERPKAAGSASVTTTNPVGKAKSKKATPAPDAATRTQPIAQSAAAAARTAPVAPPRPAGTAAPTRPGGAPAATRPAGGSPPAGAPAAAGASGAAAVGAARVTEAVRAARNTVASAAARGPRRARLNLKRIDPWSVMKFSFAVSVVLFIVAIVATSVLYLALDTMGVWKALNGSIADFVNASGGTNKGFQISAWDVIGTSMLIGAVNVVLFTALATLGAFIYNVCADLVGGIELTLAERD